MAEDDIDQGKRKFLSQVTATVGSVGLVAACAPFITSMLPDAKVEAQSGPIRVQVGSMKPGDQITVIWRGLPIWIVKRSENDVAALELVDNRLRDPYSKVVQQPEYARNEYRSRRQDLLVLVGVCTHLGCTPTYRPEPGSVDKNWPGGFYCTCHGSKFDLAGRVFKGVPAPINMEVPPYYFINEDELMIGINEAP